MALRRHTVPGGWYCDTRPAPSGRGPWCAAVWQTTHVKTHWGQLTAPGPVLFPVFDAAAQHIGAIHGLTDYVLRYSRGLGWQTDTTKALGPCGVIFDHDGYLHISRGEAGVGATGYRYVDERGKVISCSATYQHTVSGLFEYTVLPGGYVIGQGPDDNDCFLYDPSDRSYRSLIAGNARFVR